MDKEHDSNENKILTLKCSISVPQSFGEDVWRRSKRRLNAGVMNLSSKHSPLEDLM